jgi:hypothetical protein
MAARTPPKNTVPIFNPFEFVYIAPTVSELDPDIPAEIDALQEDVETCINFLGNYCLLSDSDLGGGTVNCLSMANMADVTRVYFYPNSAGVTRAGGLWLWKASLTFSCSTTVQLLFCEMCLMVDNVAEQHVSWCAPYYYNGRGIPINQFINYQLNTTFAFFNPVGTSKTYKIRVRALCSPNNAGYTIGGVGSTTQFANQPGRNVTEFRIGDGS